MAAPPHSLFKFLVSNGDAFLEIPTTRNFGLSPTKIIKQIDVDDPNSVSIMGAVNAYFMRAYVPGGLSRACHSQFLFEIGKIKDGNRLLNRKLASYVHDEDGEEVPGNNPYAQFVRYAVASTPAVESILRDHYVLKPMALFYYEALESDREQPMSEIMKSIFTKAGARYASSGVDGATIALINRHWFVIEFLLPHIMMARPTAVPGTSKTYGIYSLDSMKNYTVAYAMLNDGSETEPTLLDFFRGLPNLTPQDSPHAMFLRDLAKPIVDVLVYLLQRSDYTGQSLTLSAEQQQLMHGVIFEIWHTYLAACPNRKYAKAITEQLAITRNENPADTFKRAFNGNVLSPLVDTITRVVYPKVISTELTTQTKPAVDMGESDDEDESTLTEAITGPTPQKKEEKKEDEEAKRAKDLAEEVRRAAELAAKQTEEKKREDEASALRQIELAKQAAEESRKLREAQLEAAKQEEEARKLQTQPLTTLVPIDYLSLIITQDKMSLLPTRPDAVAILESFIKDLLLPSPIMTFHAFEFALKFILGVGVYEGPTRALAYKFEYDWVPHHLDITNSSNPWFNPISDPAMKSDGQLQIDLSNGIATITTSKNTVTTNDAIQFHFQGINVPTDSFFAHFMFVYMYIYTAMLDQVFESDLHMDIIEDWAFPPNVVPGEVVTFIKMLLIASITRNSQINGKLTARDIEFARMRKEVTDYFNSLGKVDE
jgi:hypothetical protein